MNYFHPKLFPPYFHSTRLCCWLWKRSNIIWCFRGWGGFA